MVKVIASSVRKGNVLELEPNRLYVVLTAESFFPGKGTPTTQIDMRRISDGVKTTQRYRTTEQVEKALIDTRSFTYLYDDGDSFVFMNQENYEQLHVAKDVVGDQAAYLQENMQCEIAVFNDVAVSVEIPERVTLEIVETEPVTKGQTATSSYKPALLSNGTKTTVPPHIANNTRIVVKTVDGSYVERAKD